MMKKLLWIMLILPVMAVVAGCTEDDVDKVVVDKGLDAVLNAKYPGATDVEWSRSAGYILADFNQGKLDLEAWFDGDSRWVQSATRYGVNLPSLPADVYQSFTNGEYSTWIVDEVSRYDRPDMSFYVIRIGKVGSRDLNAYYRPDGELIQAIPAMGDITPSRPVPEV